MEKQQLQVVDHQRIFEDISSKMQEFRRDMFRNIDYVNGIQYSADDLKYLHHHRRLPIVWNIVLPKILAYTGAERSNRVMARAEAVEKSDWEMAELINLLMEQDNEDTQAAWQISLAAVHAAIFRYGALMANWERTNKFPQGQYTLRALDPRDVWWDCHPSEMDFDNSEFIIYSRWYTPEHIIQKYISDPEQAAEIEREAALREGISSGKLKDRPWAERIRSFSSAYLQSDKQRSTGGPFGSTDRLTELSNYYDGGMYRVIELHQKVKEEVLKIFDPVRGETAPIPDKLKNDREYIKQQLDIRGLDERSIIRPREDRMYLSASAPALSQKSLLYNRPYAVQGAGYMIKIIPAYNFDPDRRNLRSIVDVLIDPQDLINRDLSTRAHMMNKLLNPDIYVGPRALDDEQDIVQLESQRPGKIVQLQNIDEIKFVYPDLGGINIFTGVASQALEFSEYTPGISKNSMGLKESADESGKLVQVRAGLSEAMLTLLFDNVSNAVKSVEKYHLGVIQQHMTMRRMIRTIGPDGKPEYAHEINIWDPLVKRFKFDVTVGQYDIRIDQTKYTRTERQLNLDKLIQLMQMSDEESRIDMAVGVLELIDSPSAQKLIPSAKKRAELLDLQRDVAMLNLKQQYMELSSQLQLTPKTQEAQILGLETQTMQLQLQKAQMEAAMQAQAAAAENSAPQGESPPSSRAVVEQATNLEQNPELAM